MSSRLLPKLQSYDLYGLFLYFSVCSIVMLETRWKCRISSVSSTKWRTCTTFCWTSAVSCSPSRPWWRPTGSWHPRSRTTKRPITKMKVNPIVSQTLSIDEKKWGKQDRKQFSVCARTQLRHFLLGLFDHFGPKNSWPFSPFWIK